MPPHADLPSRKKEQPTTSAASVSTPVKRGGSTFPAAGHGWGKSVSHLSFGLHARQCPRPDLLRLRCPESRLPGGP